MLLLERDRVPSNSDADYATLFSNAAKTDQELHLARLDTAAQMLLVHQVGTLHVGEVVRYKLTYTASAEKNFPLPSTLSVRIKNNAALPLRAAYLHGPYNLYVSCYPASFDPQQKYTGPGRPQFEPNLRAAGSWDATISLDVSHAEVPQTWFIEITSQISFSKSAAASFELLVGRDAKSLDCGTLGRSADSDLAPGSVKDHITRDLKILASHKYHEASKGVDSPAIKLGVADTSSLWSTPDFPSYFEKSALAFGDDESVSQSSGSYSELADESCGTSTRKQKKVHFVVVTHGLHSNIGADMLYLKERIEAAAEKAREERKSSKSNLPKASSDHNAEATKSVQGVRGDAADPSQENNTTQDQAQAGYRGDAKNNGNDNDNGNNIADNDDVDGDDDEEVVVRGFPGNVIRTERGIQYLGKRLAKYILLMTYPDQPSPPVPISRRQKAATRTNTSSSCNPVPPHDHSDTHDDETKSHSKPPRARSPYKITSISLIGHSLGGLIQTYAIAYILKHSPHFFDFIKPINFVALASPLLGLSTENPLYVRFALDFGLVGRTGQDLGLSWSAPLKVRNGLNAMIPSLGNDARSSSKSSVEDNHDAETNPRSKPLLRILPTGLAHEALYKFQNRTLYSNVVNDGIVPLLTSSLLFLDWKGLGRVEKSSRETGPVGRVAEWGWAELAGINSSAPRRRSSQDSMSSVHVKDGYEIPLSSPVTQETATAEDVTSQGKHRTERMTVQRNQAGVTSSSPPGTSSALPSRSAPSSPSLSKSFADFFSFLKPQSRKNKQSKVMRRAQTVTLPESSTDITDTTEVATESQPNVRDGSHPHGSSGSEFEEDAKFPPKTSLLEAAGDLLNPPLPSSKFILDPAQRPETIFHDRIYQPSDIPPPPPLQHRGLLRSHTSNTSSSPISTSSAHSFNKNSSSHDFATQSDSEEATQSNNRHEPSLKPPHPHTHGHSHQNQHSFKTSSGMSVEEKIARSYHHDLTWRKVLVRLEPDAHNNIIVRRMFSNAYGWPVVQHLVDMHFGSNATTQQKGHDTGDNLSADSTNIPTLGLPLGMPTLSSQRELELRIKTGGSVNAMTTTPHNLHKGQSFSECTSSPPLSHEQYVGHGDVCRRKSSFGDGDGVLSVESPDSGNDQKEAKLDLHP